MASNIQLLKSFVDGQGAGASTYVSYDADLDANFVEIEAGFNALNSEFQAFAGANSLIALDLALSSTPSVTEGFIGTDSFEPVGFLSADTQIQIPVGVAFTAAAGRVETLQTFTFTGSGGAGTRYFALQETGLVTQETAAGQGILDLYSIPWDGAAFTTASLSRLPTSGSIIVDGDDFQNCRVQEDISQGASAIIPPFTYDRIDYRVSDALRILAGIPSAGSATSSQPAASGGVAGPSLKPAAIGGSVSTPGLIIGNPSDGYDIDTGIFGTPATPALGVAVAGSAVATFGAATLTVPRTVAVTAPTPWAYFQENVQTGTTYNQVAADVGRAIVGNNGTGITVNLLAAATAGAGYVFVAKNIGAGNMTLDPNAAETIEGASTLVLATGDTAVVWTEGSLWRASVSGSDAGTWTQLQENVQTGSSYTQLAGDVGTAIVGNNGTAITIDLLAAATAGAGYVFVAKNIGAGDMTLDPNGAETIDGNATLVLSTNEAAIVWCNGTTWRVISGTGGGGASAEVATSTADGRVTISTGDPVPISDVTGATTHFYTPYKGNQIALYNGASWDLHSFTELSQATTDTTKSPAAVSTDENYDLFVWDDGGTLRCTRGPAWSTDTARGTGGGTTELVKIDGVFLNAESITNGPAAERGRYVGTIRSDGSSQLNDTLLARLVWNANNRVGRPLRVLESGDWSYSTDAYRQVNANTANQVGVVVGLVEDPIRVQTKNHVVTSTSTIHYVRAGIGLDSTTTVPVVGADANAYVSSTGASQPVAIFEGHAGLGHHFFAWLERGAGTDTQVWYALESGLFGEIKA